MNRKNSKNSKNKKPRASSEPKASSAPALPETASAPANEQSTDDGEIPGLMLVKGGSITDIFKEVLGERLRTSPKQEPAPVKLLKGAFTQLEDQYNSVVAASDQQIDSLNHLHAKNIALEAENAALRNKINRISNYAKRISEYAGGE